METLFTRLLNYYHLSEDEYAQLVRPVTTTTFTGDHYFDNMNDCVALLKRAMSHNKKIFIYGDYDCDGVISISILVKMFALLNYPIAYHVPNRYLDGYGLNAKRAEEIVNSGYEFIITVDNGVTAFEGISYAKEHGLEVLIIDHHQPDAILLMLTPFTYKSQTLGPPTSAGFTTFMLLKQSR